MLAWKWWRDCRGRVLVYLGAALAFGVLAALDATSFSAWVERYRYDPGRFEFYLYLMWNRMGYALSSPAWLGAVWMGLALGVTSLGRDYASASASFLLTRPQSRVAMLWIDWAMTQAAIVFAAALMVGSAAVIAARSLPLVDASELFWIFPTSIVVALAVYGMTLFWAVTTRSAVKGVELTVASILVVSLAPGALLDWWHIAWPENLRHWMMTIFDWTPKHLYWTANLVRVGARDSGLARPVFAYGKPLMYTSLEPYPIAALMMWIAIGLALVYGTQKIIERREV